MTARILECAPSQPSVGGASDASYQPETQFSETAEACKHAVTGKVSRCRDSTKLKQRLLKQQRYLRDSQHVLNAR